MARKSENSEYKLADVLGHGLKVVFCGTAAGTVSAEKGQYHAGPGNKFWKTLYEVGLTKRQLDPAEFRTLLAKGIGFSDVVKDRSGMDKVLREGDFERGRGRLRREMEGHQPRFLCFNGKKAAKEYLNRKRVEYGLQDERIGKTRVFVAPSTSACVVPTGVGCPEDWAWANCVRHSWVGLPDRKSCP